MTITEKDLRYLFKKCLTLQLYRHLDLSDTYTCADFLFFQDFRQQEYHMEFIMDFCLNHVAARNRSGVMRKSAQYTLQFLHTFYF